MRTFTYMSYKSHFIFGLLLACVLLFSFSACSGPKTVKVSVQGAVEMNQKQVCVIYIYQLSNDTNFMQATPESFWIEGTKDFVKDLVEDEIKIKLFPGETKDIELNISEKTKYIGAAADFYRPKKEGWRKVFDLTSKVPKVITVFIKHDSIEISY